MQLKKIYIDGYKNLIDTSIEVVNSTDIPLAIIGNNGTGKSNLIEALLHIFIGLYNDKPPIFNFEIIYGAHNKEVAVIKNARGYNIYVDGQKWPRKYFKERIRDPELMPPFPSLVFCYYSGTCTRTKNLIKKYNNEYQKTIKKTGHIDRLFVFSDMEMAEWGKEEGSALD